MVALSGDGNTVLLDDDLINGAWVYYRDGSVWTSQGKLTSGPQAILGELMPVALSFDGNTALVGALTGSALGARIFVRSFTGWSQQGNPLAGSGRCTPLEVPRRWRYRPMAARL